MSAGLRSFVGGLVAILTLETALAQDQSVRPQSADLSHEALQVFHQVEALQNAARELRAAGIDDLARAATERAEQLKHGFIARLQSEQQRVARELQAQRMPATVEFASRDQAEIRCRILEVDTGRIPAELAERFLPNSPLPIERSIRVLSGTELQDCQRHWDELTNCGAGKVVAMPQVVILNGKTAHFRGNGALPVIVTDHGASSGKADAPFQGVQVHVTPIRQPNQRWLLQLKVEHSEPNLDQHIRAAGQSSSGFHKQQMQTIVNLADGETLAVSGFSTKDKHSVVLLSVETVTPPDAARLIGPIPMPLPPPENGEGPFPPLPVPSPVPR